MRVAFVGGRGYHSNHGGVENAMREIASRLAACPDLDVDVYGQGTLPWFAATTEAPGLTIVGAPALCSRFDGNAVLALANCLYALLMRRPKVLLLFASGPSLLAILARLLRVKVIAALRAIDSQRDKWGWFNASLLRLGEISALRVADACTVNSLEMFRYYDGAARGLIYIPNGASAASAGSDAVLERLGLHPDGYLLFAARLDPVKRLHLLLRAHGRLPADCRLPLVVAGGQCTSAAYRQELEALSGTGVQFIGHVDGDILDPLMRHCAVFVLPSILEGMSNSLLEAMHSGRCVLCADVAANCDVVQQEPAALFRADDLDDLTQRLTDYCRHPEQRRRCGQAMQQIACQHYCWDTTAERYRELIFRTAGWSTPATGT